MEKDNMKEEMINLAGTQMKRSEFAQILVAPMLQMPSYRKMGEELWEQMVPPRIRQLQEEGFSLDETWIMYENDLEDRSELEAFLKARENKEKLM